MQSNKDLLKFLFATMDKLDKGKIPPEVAKEQANLARQANNSLRYEVEKTTLLLKLEQAQSYIKLKDIEAA